MDWIRVDEKKPPNGHYVLCALYDAREKVNMHFILIAERLNNDYFDGNDGRSILGMGKGSYVTHWMPLPDVPKESDAK